MSNLKTITPGHASALVRKGAVLIDVREAHEHAAEHIPGARHYALSQIDSKHPIEAGDAVLIFHCKSGGRTDLNAGRIAVAAGGCEAYVLGGGIDAWRRAGLPTIAAEKRGQRTEGGILSRISNLFR
jgi:rhodanese-related sulfurtransferase